MSPLLHAFTPFDIKILIFNLAILRHEFMVTLNSRPLINFYFYFFMVKGQKKREGNIASTGGQRFLGINARSLFCVTLVSSKNEVIFKITIGLGIDHY
jgi:hypothetical protein